MTRCRVSKRTGLSLQRWIADAATSASRQLVAKRVSANEGAKPAASSTSTCAGKTAATQSHQRCGGVMRRTAVRSAFGGQMRDVVAGGKRSRNPICAPRA
jgi:hypothetical protein